MAELRLAFRRQVTDLGDRLLAAADGVSEMLDTAVQGILDDDPGTRDRVRVADERIDAAHLEVRERVLALFALEAPVAADLRILAATLHANLHLARMGDLAVAAARQAGRSGDVTDAVLRGQLVDMAGHAAALPAKAFTALARRDPALARTLPVDDQPVDDLNAALRRRVTATEGTDDIRAAMAYVLAARSIERFADHAVAVGEEAIYAATGTWEPLEVPEGS